MAVGAFRRLLETAVGRTVHALSPSLAGLFRPFDGHGDPAPEMGLGVFLPSLGDLFGDISGVVLQRGARRDSMGRLLFPALDRLYPRFRPPPPSARGREWNPGSHRVDHLVHRRHFGRRSVRLQRHPSDLSYHFTFHDPLLDPGGLHRVLIQAPVCETATSGFWSTVGAADRIRRTPFLPPSSGSPATRIPTAPGASPVTRSSASSPAPPTRARRTSTRASPALPFSPFSVQATPNFPRMPMTKYVSATSSRTASCG